MTTPEERAREQIDALLVHAGWEVQDREAMSLFGRLRQAILQQAFSGKLVTQDHQAAR